MSGLKVRIGLAGAEADLQAVVWPGVETIYCPRAESAARMQEIDAMVGRLERQRGIRPGTVALHPLIETPEGVAGAHAIASATSRIRAFGPGPKLYVHLDVEPDRTGSAMAYAYGECELAARALDLEPAAVEYLAD